MGRYREGLESGRQLVGAFCAMDGYATAHILAAAGFDFLIFDRQHASYSWPEIENLCFRVRSTGASPFIRAASVEEAEINLCLDQPIEGLVLPNTSHISNLIEFLETWPKINPIVIHCWAGISRSTAAAFISQCFFNPSVDEFEIAQGLRRASASATPNRRLVDLADDVLDRRGRMRKAIEEIGRGELARVGEPFSLPVEIRRN